MAKPLLLPAWATTLANDPITGQPNRAEPAVGKKITGFNFNEKPPRQDINWLHNLTYDWLNYFDAMLSKLEQPVFMYHGVGYFQYDHAANKLSISSQMYEATHYNTELENFQISTSSPLLNPGFVILRQSFRRPLEFTKLNLTFLARTDLASLGNDRSMRTYVLRNNATADSVNITYAAFDEIKGPSLYAGPTVRSIQLDLSGEAAGDPLTLVHTISAPSIALELSNFYIQFGQLRSSWSV